MKEKTTVVTHVEDPRAAELRIQIEKVKGENSALNQKITFHTNRMTQDDLYKVSLQGLKQNPNAAPGKSPNPKPRASSPGRPRASSPGKPKNQGLPQVGGKTEQNVGSS